MPAFDRVCEDRLDRAAVLALKSVKHLQALLCGDQRAFVPANGVVVGPQLGGAVAKLKSSSTNPCGNPVELGIDRVDACKRGFGLGDESRRSARILGADGRHQGLTGGVSESLGMHEPIALHKKPALLVGIRACLFDLFELESQ